MFVKRFSVRSISSHASSTSGRNGERVLARNLKIFPWRAQSKSPLLSQSAQSVSGREKYSSWFGPVTE